MNRTDVCWPFLFPVTVCASLCDYVSINAAIQSAHPGDDVSISAGSYTENGPVVVTVPLVLWYRHPISVVTITIVITQTLRMRLWCTCTGRAAGRCLEQWRSRVPPIASGSPSQLN